jgi:hypothetical protein
MTRVYGRAPSGERVIGRVPQHDGPKVTRLGALGVQGLHAVMTVEGATDADVLRAYVRQALGPPLTPGDSGVRDKLRAHTAVGGQQALARRGARRLSCRYGLRHCFQGVAEGQRHAQPLSEMGYQPRRK